MSVKRHALPVCPHCGSRNVCRLNNSTKAYAKGMLNNLPKIAVNVSYHCFACNRDFVKPTKLQDLRKKKT